jgi:hypothetical protein
LERDLSNGGFRLTAPDPQDLEHNRAIIRLTILRPFFTRGRDEESKASNYELMQAKAEKLKAWLTGDIRQPTFNFATLDASLTVRDVAVGTALALTECFVDEIDKNRPSTSKWWTFEPALIAQGGLALINNLLSRSIQHAFDADIQDDGGDSSGDEFHATCRKHVMKAVEFASDEFSFEHGIAGCAVVYVTALWATEPVDKLSKVTSSQTSIISFHISSVSIMPHLSY